MAPGSGSVRVRVGSDSRAKLHYAGRSERFVLNSATHLLSPTERIGQQPELRGASSGKREGAEVSFSFSRTWVFFLWWVRGSGGCLFWWAGVGRR
jgi:hypothetical protein